MPVVRDRPKPPQGILLIKFRVLRIIYSMDKDSQGPEDGEQTIVNRREILNITRSCWNPGFTQRGCGSNTCGAPML